MKKFIVIARRYDRARDWLRSHHGLTEKNAIIVIEDDSLRGLEGIERNAEHGLLAFYTEDWFMRSEESIDRLVKMLKILGFNGPW